jgi:Na+/melibiose symporter-like transporter
MMKQQTMSVDGLRRASKLSMLISQAGAGANMCFYVIMVYASYIANEGYGIPVAIAGLIVTGSRVFDGITDPIIAAVFDRMSAERGGKIRKFLIAGWGIMTVADMTMYNWLAGRLDGFPGMLIFILIYVVHIIGYTVLGIGMSVASVAVTNDPKQRPFMNLASTCYSYLVPITLNTVMAFAILPRYDNQYNAACLKETTFWYIIAGAVFIILACVGVAPIDNAEVLNGAKAPDGDNKVGLKEMAEMLKKNKPLRMYVITGASDKLAQQTGSQAVILTLMNGILIANYQTATMIGNTGSIIGILFAFVGGAYIAKFGAKNATTVWSWVSIALSMFAVGFCLILGPKGMSAIGNVGIPMVIYVIVMIATNGTKMILSTATGTMKADVTDYWMEQTGNYMPGSVSAVYSFIDKLISSLSSTIAAVTVALIGYKNTMPQMGDEATWSVFWITMILMYGFPIVGWLCNVLAMRGYELDKERMVEVQKNIAKEKKK